MKKYFEKTRSELIFIKEKPTANFWDKYWDSEDFLEDIKKGGGDLFVSKFTKKFIKPAKTKKILEGGCGKGNFVYSLKLNGYDSYGVDFAEKTINKIKDKMPDLKIYAGNVERLDFSDDYFDGYWSLGIIEHSYDGYEKISHEMKRVLKKGGYLFITFPTMSLLRKIKGKLNMYPTFKEELSVPDNFYQFVLNWKTVKKHFVENGFEFIYKKNFDGTKGMKDEISILAPLLQKIYSSHNFSCRILNGIISRLTAPFCGHSTLLIFRKGKSTKQKILKYADTSLNLGRKNIECFIRKIKFNTVLDIGAGDGDDLLTAKKINPNAKLQSIEFFPPAIENLKKHGIECFSSNIEKDAIPLPDNSLDLIIANQLLEHAKEIYWIFSEVCRTLKKGQYFIVGIPNLASLHNRILLLLGQQPSCIYSNSAHVRSFTKKDIESFAKIGGLKLIQYSGSNFYPFPPFIANFLSKMFPSLSVGNFFLFRKEKEYNSEYLKYPEENRLATNFYLGDKH